MKIFKTDGRYNYHKEGLHYAIDFGYDFRGFSQVCLWLNEHYGPIISYCPGSNGLDYNKNWRKSIKQGRIYLKNQADTTAILLKFTG